MSNYGNARRGLRGVSALGIVLAGLGVSGIGWGQGAAKPAKPAASASAKPSSKPTPVGNLPPVNMDGTPPGAFEVQNQKGPGLPVVVAVKPWPSQALGAVVAPASSGGGGAKPQVVSDLAPPSNAQEEALADLQKHADLYKKGAGGYAKAVGQIIRQRYEAKRKARLSSLQEAIDRDQAELKKARLDTMERLKAFLAKYPDVPEHTPSAMFRLAALYEEQAIDTDLDPSDPKYVEKVRAAYEPAEKLYREVIVRFPNYTQRASVQFFLGALLSDTGRGPESQWVWRALVCSNHYQFPVPAPANDAEAKAREKWKDGVPPMPQDHDVKYWDDWRTTHYTPADPKKKAKPAAPKKGAKPAPVVTDTEDSYKDVYPDDCVPIPAPIPLGQDEMPFLAQTWWRLGEYHYSRGDEAAEEEGYFGASPYRYNRALRAYEHAVKTSNETVKVFTMYKIAWTYFKQQRYNAARQQFLALLAYFDEKEKKGGQSGDLQMRQDAWDYIASALTYLDMEGPGPDEPFIEREDVFGMFSGKELEKKLEIAVDRVQDPKYVPQDKTWTPKIYKALATEFESDEVQGNAIKTYELILKKYECDPEAPLFQKKIADLYDYLALKAESKADKEEYASKALEARTKLLNYVGKDSKWVECNKNNPDAIRQAETLMSDGVKYSASKHTALAREYVSKAGNYPEGSKERKDWLQKAREEYKLAEKGWTAYLAQDADAADSYESKYWIADSRHKAVKITYLLGEKLDPAQVKAARDASVEVRDSVLDDKYLRYAAYFAVEVYDLLAKEGYDAYKNSGCLPGNGLEVLDSPLDEPGDACRPDSEKDAREKRRIWVRPIPENVLSTLKEREEYVSKVPESLDLDKNSLPFRYFVADTLYRYGRFEEATPRFEAIWNEQCGKTELGYEAWYRLVVMSNLREDSKRSKSLTDAAKAKSCAITPEQKVKEKALIEGTDINALFKEADEAFNAAEKETDPKLKAAKYREAAAKYEAALKVAPSRPEAPRAAINSAYCYKQVNEYKRAAEVYRFFLDKYGKEEDLIAYRDGDPKKGIKKDPEQFNTRLDYTKKALGELGRTYLQAFDYANAAKLFEEKTGRKLLDEAERRDAAFTAVVLQANLGNRDKMLQARTKFLEFKPPANEKAEIDFIVATFEYNQWKADPKNAGQKAKAATALDGYYNTYKGQGPALRYVVEVSYDLAHLRKEGGEASFRDWYKKTIEAFAAYKAANKDAIGTRYADMGAEAAYFFVNEQIEKEWDPLPGGQPRFKYEGTADKVVKQLEADDKKRVKFIDDLENINKTYVSKKWFPIVNARQGSVDDQMRTALAKSKVEVLDPATAKKIKDIEDKAQKILDDPKASDESKGQAAALLEKADAIRQNTNKAWKDKRKQYYDVLEPEMIDRYARAYIRGKQFDVKDPWVTKAVQRLAYYTDQLEDTKMRLYLANVEKDLPPFKYKDQMFKQARPGSIESPQATPETTVVTPPSAPKSEAGGK